MFTVLQTRIAFVRRITLTGILAWLIEADRRYRERQKLREMPDFRLRDMGMTRNEADTAFLRQQF